MFTLEEMVSKCQTCNFTAEPQDSFCKVDKSHKMAQKFMWVNENREYKYSDSPSSCD